MEPMWVGATAAEHLRRRRRWRVHSLFASSANLRLEPDASGPAPALIHIGAGAVEAPFGIDVTAADWRAWRSRLHGASARGDWDPVRGRLGGVAPLDLGARWREATGDSTVPALPSAASVAVQPPAPVVAVHASGLPVGSDAATVLDRVRTAFDGLLAGGTDAATWLLGRGPGVTPSGDDVLVGMLGVLHRTGLPGRSADAAASLRERVTADPVTTDVSIAYLDDACRGRFASPLRRVLLAADPAEGVARLAALRTMGHTSGADTILGLAIAVDALRHLPAPSPHTPRSHTWAA